jgi:predicted nuclease of predicted toxin-antitoxin system
MNLYLDDCLDSDRLVATLTNAGHRVETPRSASTLGRQDEDHLEYAARRGLTLMTKNPVDFRRLHDEWQAQGRTHHGIWLVYQDNDKAKDMQPHEVARAIENLLASGIPIRNEVYALNHWR